MGWDWEIPDNRCQLPEFWHLTSGFSVQQQSVDHGDHKEHGEADSGALDPEWVTVWVRSHLPGALTKLIATGYRYGSPLEALMAPMIGGTRPR